MMRGERRFYGGSPLARPHSRESGGIDSPAVEPPQLDRNRADEMCELGNRESSPDRDSGCA
jgi:hypothetical protein